MQPYVRQGFVKQIAKVSREQPLVVLLASSALPSHHHHRAICLRADTQHSNVLIIVFLHCNQLQVICNSKVDFAVARKAFAAYFSRHQSCGQLRSFQDPCLSCNSCPSVDQVKPKRYAAFSKHTLLGVSSPSILHWPRLPLLHVSQHDCQPFFAAFLT